MHHLHQKPTPDSHTGSIILATHRAIEDNISCTVSPLSWGCKKIQKVVPSTLAAETMSLASTLDQLSWIRLFWAWIHDGTVDWRQPEKTLPQFAEIVFLQYTEGSRIWFSSCSNRLQVAI